MPLAQRVLLATTWSLVWCLAYLQVGPPVKAFALQHLGDAQAYFYSHYGPEMLLFLWGWWGIPLLQVILLGRLHPALHVLLVVLSVAGFAFAVYRAPWQTALDAARLCPTESGLRIHRRVAAASLYGVREIRDWHGMGFEFVEYTDGLGQHFRLGLEQGNVVREAIPVPESTYELVALPLETPARRLSLRRLVVRDRLTGEVLGESRLILIHRGWADRVLANGFHFAPPACFGGVPVNRGGPKPIGATGLVKAVITPRAARPMP
ncbi:MAG: hypothetical protein FJ164_08035 [Gammaproteobacteria bacterium]|nr:hypothetical protein [Gammaproteobacteria bacterium]